MSTNPLLDVKDLSVYYGKSRALENVSFHIDEGEIVSVIGPNGAGKTTLLNAVSRVKEYEGTIRFDGEEISSLNEQEAVNRGIVHTPEERALYPYFSVHNNLLMGAYSRNDQEAIKSDLRRIYDLFPQLDERRSQHAGTLSGGEQQMLAIGRSLMTSPNLLMLDEPTLGLAPIITEEVNDVLEELRDAGMTILLAEQNASFAMEVAERMYLLETGNIELSGNANEFKDNEYIRDAYIGIM